MAKCYFLGVKRSAGEMAGENGGKIVWDNAVVYRCGQIDTSKNGESSGYEAMNPCKIKMEDFENVTGETFAKFLENAPKRVLKPMVVLFGEMKGQADNRKADTEYLRFPDAKTGEMPLPF